MDIQLEKYVLPTALGDCDIDILEGQAAGVFSCYFGVEPGNCTPNLLITEFDELYKFLLNRNKKRN
jgi:hypothetical protein